MKEQSHISKNKINNSIKQSSSEYVGQRKEATSKGCILTDNRSNFTVQKKENNTGLPDILKSGIENMSGYSMDDVRVHYNSGKPAQLNAHAYAQGTEIHLGTGQEKHLPHEAWHIVQQKQGRVQPNTSFGGVQINDNKSLEKEADIMGVRALQMKSEEGESLEELTQLKGGNTIQRNVMGAMQYGALGATLGARLGIPGALIGGLLGGTYGYFYGDENDDVDNEEFEEIEVNQGENEANQVAFEKEISAEQREANIGSLTNTSTGEFVKEIVGDNYNPLEMDPQHLVIGTDNKYQNLVTPILQNEIDADKTLPTFLTGYLYNQAKEYTPERNQQFIKDFIKGIPQNEEERANYRVTLNHNMVERWMKERKNDETFNDYVQSNYPPKSNKEYDGTKQEIRDLLNAGFTPTSIEGERRMELRLDVGEKQEQLLQEMLQNVKEKQPGRFQKQGKQFGFRNTEKSKDKGSWRKK